MRTDRPQIILIALSIAAAFSIVVSQKNELPELKDPTLVITKSKRTLDLLDGGKLIRTYSIALGFEPAGDKQTEGDGRTPEGEFYIFTKNAKSRFHLSLGVSYPGREDAERGLKEDLISKAEYDEIVAAIAERRMPLQKTKLGGEIYIHGGGTDTDWTDGCVALVNDEIAELFRAVQVGAKVSILP